MTKFEPIPSKFFFFPEGQRCLPKMCTPFFFPHGKRWRDKRCIRFLRILVNFEHMEIHKLDLYTLDTNFCTDLCLDLARVTVLHTDLCLDLCLDLARVTVLHTTCA
jgi:hypothetical protein